MRRLFRVPVGVTALAALASAPAAAQMVRVQVGIRTPDLGAHIVYGPMPAYPMAWGVEHGWDVRVVDPAFWRRLDDDDRESWRLWRTYDRRYWRDVRAAEREWRKWQRERQRAYERARREYRREVARDARDARRDWLRWEREQQREYSMYGREGGRERERGRR